MYNMHPMCTKIMCKSTEVQLTYNIIITTHMTEVTTLIMGVSLLVGSNIKTICIHACSMFYNSDNRKIECKVRGEGSGEVTRPEVHLTAVHCFLMHIVCNSLT